VENSLTEQEYREHNELKLIKSIWW